MVNRRYSPLHADDEVLGQFKRDAKQRAFWDLSEPHFGQEVLHARDRDRLREQGPIFLIILDQICREKDGLQMRQLSDHGKQRQRGTHGVES